MRIFRQFPVERSERLSVIVTLAIELALLFHQPPVAQRLVPFVKEVSALQIPVLVLDHESLVKPEFGFATFGADVVGPDGEIDRKILGGKVFGANSRLDELTAIVWPAIQRMAEEEIAVVRASHPNQHIVLEAAVLLEAGWQNIVDEIWVTVVDRKVAIQRAMVRDGLDAEAVEARIDAQLSNAERRAAADQVIDNSGNEAELISRVKQIWDNI